MNLHEQPCGRHVHKPPSSQVASARRERCVAHRTARLSFYALNNNSRTSHAPLKRRPTPRLVYPHAVSSGLALRAQAGVRARRPGETTIGALLPAICRPAGCACERDACTSTFGQLPSLQKGKKRRRRERNGHKGETAGVVSPSTHEVRRERGVRRGARPAQTGGGAALSNGALIPALYLSLCLFSEDCH